MCLDIDLYRTSDTSPVHLYRCHPEDSDPAHQNQAWAYDADTKEIIATGTAAPMRLDVSNYGADGPGSTIWIYEKTGAANQKWDYDEGTGQLTSEQIGFAGKLCMDSAPAPPPPRPCDVAPAMSQPWCDPSQPLEVRVADLVSRIQDEEVVGLFSNGAAGVPSLGIPRYQWWSEALHGVGDSPGVTFSGNTPFATSFPQVLLTSSSLNSSLFGMIGDAISTEARAFNNQGHAGNTFWTPNINIFRDPRWGRGQETPGEDPYVNSEYAAHFVPGMQGGTAPKYIKASSCLKHYLAYSLEDWHGVNQIGRAHV